LHTKNTRLSKHLPPLSSQRLNFSICLHQNRPQARLHPHMPNSWRLQMRKRGRNPAGMHAGTGLIFRSQMIRKSVAHTPKHHQVWSESAAEGETRSVVVLLAHLAAGAHWLPRTISRLLFCIHYRLLWILEWLWQQPTWPTPGPISAATAIIAAAAVFSVFSLTRSHSLSLYVCCCVHITVFLPTNQPPTLPLLSIIIILCRQLSDQ
jgi:hypothetical protein